MKPEEIKAGCIYAGGARSEWRRVDSIVPHEGFATDIHLSVPANKQATQWMKRPRMTLKSFASWANRMVTPAEVPGGDEPTNEERIRYTSGSCHVFAIAMKRLYGARLVAVTDSFEPCWIDDADPDNCIPAVTHVYAAIGDTAFDVSGACPLEDIELDCRERFDAKATGTEEFRTEDELRAYVRDADPDRGEVNDFLPLAPYSVEDIREAEDVARRIYGAAPIMRASDPTLDTCPFCKGECEFQVGHHSFHDVHIACGGCGAEGPSFGIEENEEDDMLTNSMLIARNKRQAARHWNTRA